MLTISDWAERRAGLTRNRTDVLPARHPGHDPAVASADQASFAVGLDALVGPRRTMLEAKDVREKIVLMAMDLNPNLATECGQADKWLRVLSERFSVEAFVDRKHEQDLSARVYENVQFRFVDLDGPIVSQLKNLGLYNLVNASFARRAMRVLASEVPGTRYLLIHCITPMGIHSHNHFYKLGIPVVVGPLGGGLDDPPGFETLFKSIGVRNRLRNLYYSLLPLNPAWRRYFENARLVIVGTELVLKKLPPLAAEKTMVVFEPAIDTEFFRPLPRSDRKRLRIVYVGRLELVKGCTLLLEAFQSLSRDGFADHDVELMFCGTGSQEAALRTAVTTAGLTESVTVAGHLSHDEIPKMLSDSDIFCLPTLREPSGGSILEAMACGLPVVTTDYGGPSYSVTEDCGIKIRPQTPQQYVRDLEAALSKLILDQGLRTRMGIEGRRRAIDQFSDIALHRKIQEIYETLIPDSPEAR
ncbi:MAG: glycosyltransferase family 4 protein [Coriobacteriia bacterium]